MTHTETTTQGPTVEALLCYPLIGYLSKCLFCMLVEIFTFIRHHNKIIIDTLLYCSIKTISFSVESYCKFYYCNNLGSLCTAAPTTWYIPSQTSNLP